MRTRRALVLAAAGGTAAALAVTAAAQVGQPAPPILHQDVRSPRLSAGGAGRRGEPARPPATSSDAIIGEEPAPGRNPAAIGTGGKILPEPRDGEAPAPDEPVLGQHGFAADRSTAFRPDDATGADDTLTYVGVFNPSVIPFKRMSALDAVDPDYTLRVSDATLVDVEVGGEPRPGWDRFWGSVLVDLQPGRDAPLPSVAPGMRILSYEVEPATQLTFSRDSADNFYVRSEEAGARGVHRLVFLVEADPVYFAPRVPQRVRLTDVARARGAPRLPELPDEVRRMARNVQAHLHIEPSRDYLAATLDVLVDHFREFRPKAFEPSQGGLYWDLTVNQAGVCRHRSFAFVVTALSLGIPARFVSNEAHAFTEVWVPESGWIRIDLGGASDRLDVRNADGKSMYRPRGEDPFPKPEAYTEGGYSTLDGTLTGLTPEQVAEAQSRRDGSGDGGGGHGDGGDAQGGQVSPDVEVPPSGRMSPGPGSGLPQIPAEALRGKRGTSIRVDQVSSVGFRGETIRVEGIVTGEGGAGVGDLRVEVYLAPAGRGGDGANLVGATVTGPDGRYRAEVLVPYDVPLETHEVFVGTPGSSTQQPAITR
ncbi:MAG TPA: transglutaminase domain-containing protein [Kofleriaceae bacterium]|nr:transglutaminase domain-containing protein [Kofleriaceae bacterium]